MEIISTIVPKGRWRLPDGTRVETYLNVDPGFGAVYDPIPPTTEERKAALISRLAEKRWQAEEGGFSFGGATVMSDAKSQSKINALMTSIQVCQQLGIPVSLQWKCKGDVWIALDATSGTQLYLAALQHVQTLFGREGALAAQIHHAASAEELDALSEQVEAFA